MKKEMIYELVEKGFEDNVEYTSFLNKFISKIRDEGYLEMANVITNIKNKKVQINYSTKVEHNNFKYLGIEISKDIELIKTGYERSLVNSVFLHGRPGTGKTTFIHKLAKELNTPLVELRMSSILDSRFGETIKKFETFMISNIDIKQIIFIDEAESLFRKRGQRNDVFESDRLLTVMLKIMDRNKKAMIVLSSNLLKTIDKAILRRFDFFLNFDDVSINLLSELKKSIEKYGIEVKSNELKLYSDQLKKTSKDINFSKINYVARRIALEKITGAKTEAIVSNIKNHIIGAEIENTQELKGIK